LDSTKRHILIAKLLSISFSDDTELQEFFNLLNDTNMQLGCCGNDMPDNLLVDIAF
jgi:hypothetical protein